jgi:hypothetical protein
VKQRFRPDRAWDGIDVDFNPNNPILLAKPDYCPVITPAQGSKAVDGYSVLVGHHVLI